MADEAVRVRVPLGARIMSVEQHIFTLLDVCRSIQKTLTARYGSSFWVRAEMHKLNLYPASGHCFPDLLQKEEGEVVAEMRATLWRADYQRINRKFLQIVREPLGEGIEILFEARIQYDPKYGLSLRILDIDPTYALGRLERERALCVQRLKEEALWDRNRSLPFPKVPSRIAVISAETSKGYSDFMQVLRGNTQGYGFYMKLFSALLQGEAAEASLLAALHAVQDFPLDFDVVVIIRGGGGEVGLNVYNHYALAKEICTYPVPVLTGIGHSTNLTVGEEVAFFHAITPTELAVFILRQFDTFYSDVSFFMDELSRLSQERLIKEAYRLERSKLSLKSPLLRLQYNMQGLQDLQERLKRAALQFLKTEREGLKEIGNILVWADPSRNLKRGYSLTYQGDKLVFSGESLKEGCQIRTVLAQGTVLSRVEKLSGNTNTKKTQKNG